MQLKPSDIRFSQDSINNRFDQRSSHAYKSVGETLDDLCDGRCSINDIPTITVVNEDGNWITADNRRLWVFRELERLGKCTTIPVQRGYYIPDAKRTSYNSGKSISVRRNAGGRWHTKPTVYIPTAPFTPPPSKPALAKPALSTNIYNIGDPLQNRRALSSIGNQYSSRIQPVEPSIKIESYRNVHNGVQAKDTVLPIQTNEVARPCTIPTNQITSTATGYSSYKINRPSTMSYGQNNPDGCRPMSTDAVTSRPSVPQWRSNDTTMIPVRSAGIKRESEMDTESSLRHYGYNEGVFPAAVTTNDTRAVQPDNVRSIPTPSHEVNLENVIPEIQGEGHQSRDTAIVNMFYRDEQKRKRRWCTIL